MKTTLIDRVVVVCVELLATSPQGGVGRVVVTEAVDVEDAGVDPRFTSEEDVRDDPTRSG